MRPAGIARALSSTSLPPPCIPLRATMSPGFRMASEAASRTMPAAAAAAPTAKKAPSPTCRTTPSESGRRTIARTDSPRAIAVATISPATSRSSRRSDRGTRCSIVVAAGCPAMSAIEVSAATSAVETPIWSVGQRCVATNQNSQPVIEARIVATMTPTEPRTRWKFSPSRRSKAARARSRRVVGPSRCAAPLDGAPGGVTADPLQPDAGERRRQEGVVRRLEPDERRTPVRPTRERCFASDLRSGPTG